MLKTSLRSGTFPEMKMVYFSILDVSRMQWQIEHNESSSKPLTVIILQKKPTEVLCKKDFLKNSQMAQENTYVGNFFW